LKLALIPDLTRQRPDNHCRLNILPRLSATPADVMEILVKWITSFRSHLEQFAGFLFTVALALEDAAFPGVKLNMNITTASTMSTLMRYAQHLGSNLAAIECEGGFLTDDLLQLLSTSRAAPFIKIIRAPISALSNASVDAWHRFKSLEEIVLDRCDSVGFETLMAISELPNIRILSAHRVSFRPSWDQVASLLLPSKMPHLEELVFDLISSENDEVHVGRSAAPLFANRPSLKKVHCLLRSPAVAKSLHQVAPNLESFSGVWELDLSTQECLEITSLMPNLRSMTVDGGCHSSADLSRLANSCPLLKDLSISLNILRFPLDFSVFKDLKYLDVTVRELGLIGSLPPRLVDLNIRDDSFHNDFTDSESTNFAKILVASSGLKNVMIDCNYVVIRPAAFRLLVQALESLESFTVMQNSFEGQSEPVIMTSSRLRDFRLGSELQASGVYLPAFNSLPDIEGFGKLTLKEIPNLTAACGLVTQGKGYDEQKDLETAEQLHTVVERFSSQLRTLRHSESIDQILKMRQLETIVFPSPILESDLLVIMKNLPTLVDVSAQLDSSKPLSDLDWLAHGNIRSLELQWQRADPGPSSAASRLRITGNEFPRLDVLKLDLFNRCVDSVFIGTLIELKRVMLTCCGQPDRRVAAEFSGCPHARILTFSGCAFSHLSITQVPTVSIVRFHSCKLPEDDAHIQCSIPKLDAKGRDARDASFVRLKALNMQ
jgi:hypothetical protein